MALQRIRPLQVQPLRPARNWRGRSSRHARRLTSHAVVIALVWAGLDLALLLGTHHPAQEAVLAASPDLALSPAAVVSSPPVAPVASPSPTAARQLPTLEPRPTAPPAPATSPSPVVRTARLDVWSGELARDGNVRSAPSVGASIVRDVAKGEPVEVGTWVAGDPVDGENTTWAQIAPGQFVYADLLVPEPLAGPPPAPADAPTEGRWIDVNLTLQVATAYEGTRVVRSVRVSAGRPGWETPVGAHQVLRRVERDTMDGASLAGQGPGGQGAKYHIDDVGFVQYFTADGAAIHENTWRTPASFGVPGSHGCIGMLPADAKWFWDWATVGTTVLVHA